MVSADIAHDRRNKVDFRVRARINARRRFAAEGHGKLFDDLRDVLYEHNPLNLPKNGSARDEYGSPVATVLPRLSNFSSIEQFQFALEDEMKKHYPHADFTAVDWVRVASDSWKTLSDFQREQTKVR